MRTVIHRTARLLGGLALLAGILLSLSAPARAQAVSFTGSWKTLQGEGNSPFTVTLAQTGDEVTGTYSPGNGKILNGVVVGRKGTFDWTQEGGWEGTGEWTMDEDGKGFIGTATALKPRQFTHAWSTPHGPVASFKRVLDTVAGGARQYKNTLEQTGNLTRNGPRHVPFSFTGVWNTVSGTGKQIEVSLQQTGDKVTGTYMPGSAHIQGVVTGRVLRFQWTQDDGLSGIGRFKMGDDGNSFSGSSSSSKDPDAAGTPWNGTRAPVSFTGCWKLTGGMYDGETMCLKQDIGGRVTAPEFEGTISGNTLRFTHRPTGDYRSGRFIMDEGGKSFRGYWHPGNDTELNKDPCTGILVPTPLNTKETVTLASFAGAWLTKLGQTGAQLILQQAGNQVTGEVRGIAADLVIIREGIVDGHTLRFKVVRAGRDWRTGVNLPDVFMGSGELVMDEGGRSFTGKLLGTATSGTLISGGKTGGSDGKTDGATLNGKRPAVSFTGCWKLTGGRMDDNTICLKQESGGRVTATVGDFEGMVSGNRLRFTQRPAGAHRSGRLIMDEGGKSFRGYWHTGDDTELKEDPCTGILVPAPKK